MVASTKAHAVLLASPGMGHLIPMTELANHLATNLGYHVTVFAVAMEPSQKKSSLLPNPNHSNSTPTQYDLVVLPYVDSSVQMSPTDKIMTRLARTMRAYIPILQDQLESMAQRPVLLIVDLFGTEFLKLGDKFNMTKYVYIPSNAWFLAETIYVPLLDKNVKQHGPLNIPGCKRVEYDDILDPVLDPDNIDYDVYVRIGREIGEADGVMLNTWEDLESNTLFALRNNDILKKILNKPVYPVGPLVREAKPECIGKDLLGWLDEQPRESVIYVSFGSGGTLTSQQTMELAWGLELSQQRFVWVVRPPVEDDQAGALFQSMDGHDRISSYLPDGFLTQAHMGRVIPMWAPQTEILTHPSIGGFISHCGWNSTLESLVNGVPIIAWPLYAEQNMNAALLEEEIGVAIRPKVLPSKEMVGRVEIEKMVTMMIEGDEGRKLRHRVKEVQKKALTTLMGSSFKSLVLVANHVPKKRLNGY